MMIQKTYPAIRIMPVPARIIKTTLLLSLLVCFNSSLKAQDISKQVGKSNCDIIEIQAINDAIKNGNNSINTVDSIPICSAFWSFVGATGVVPDNDSAGLTMNLPISDVVGTNMGTDVNLVGVGLYIQHYRIGDIKVELISPSGTTVLLVDRMGYPATLPYGCTGDNINATFVRGTGAEAENVCHTPPPALGGVHTAETGHNLNDINIAGGSPNGIWHLRVTDLKSGEQAFVLSWKLYFDQQPPNAVYTINTTGLFVDLVGQNTLQGNATYTWSFGDGDSAVGQHVNHQYPLRGEYTITLVVEDSCGIDSISESYALESVPCYIEFPSTTTPTAITDNHPSGDTLVLNTNTVIGQHLGKDVQLVKVCVQGTHPSVGQLKMKLISPGGVVVTLLDRPFFPYLPVGCTYPNFNFCIIHGDSADNEYACDSSGAAVKGEFTAFTPQDIRSVNDQVTSPNGAWKLVVYDMIPGQTGTVDNWSLVFDQQDPDPGYTYTFDGLNLFINSKNLPSVNYHWDFGDGTPLDNNSSPTHTYATPGLKTVTVYTDNACSMDTLIRTIRMYACEEVHEYTNVPVAIPDYDPAGLVIPFTISGVSGNTLGVDAFVTRVCITSDHQRPGDLQVRIQAPNGKLVYLLNRPFRGITGDGCWIPGIDMCLVEGSANTTQFVCDYVTGPPGINGFYTGIVNPLEYINLNGGSANGIWKLYVYDKAPFNTGSITSFKIYFGKFAPIPNFTYSMTDSGQATFASANVSTVSYLWDFGDGGTSTLPNPSHTYAANGIYTVKLIAIDSCITDSSTQVVYVTTYNNGCISGFGYNGGPVSIADADSVAGSAVNINLNNVNGSILGTDVNLVKISIKGQHTRVGDLKMKLIAPNGEEAILFDRPGYPASATGCLNNDFDFTMVNGQGLPLEGICKPTPPALHGTARTAFTGNDLGMVNFAGGSPNGNWQLVVYDYAVGELGIVEEVTLFFDSQLPNPDFTFTTNLNTATFNVIANPVASYSWSFGDGFTSTVSNPVHLYADTGSYTVTLVVTDTCGTDSLTQIVNIQDILQTCVESYDYLSQTIITDNKSDGDTIVISPQNITGLQLGVDVSLVKICLSGVHTNVGDLKMTLIAPNGVAIDLMDQPGYPASPKGCTGDDFELCFTKGTALPVEDSCSTGIPSLAGNFNAANGYDLLQLNNGGGSPNGNWILVVSDLAAGDSGIVNSVQLYFNNQPHTNASFTYLVSLNNIYFDAINQTDADYVWSFGDGDSAFFADPSHSYATSGNYTVTLTVSDSCGSNSSQQIVPVIVYPEPTCVKEYVFPNVPKTIPNNDSLGVTCFFSVSGVHGTTLGVDANLVKVHISGTHDRMGDLKAQLTAPNGQVIMLMDQPGYPATAKGCLNPDFDFEVVRGINYDVENICGPVSPSIQGTYTATNGQNLDSINLAGGNPNGMWKLNVSDNAQTVFGGQLTGFQLFFDNQPLADATFTYNIVGNSVEFTSANDSGVIYSWSFGGGATSTDANPVYSFPLTGNYPVTLSATDSCGTDSTTQIISVVTYAEPTCLSTVDFTGTPLNIPDNDSAGVTLPLVVSGISGTALGNDVRLVKVCITGFIGNSGDIKATLIAPNGAVVDLMDRPGYPALANGCPNADFDFCVIRGIGNSCENSCSSLPPAIGGEKTAMQGFNLDSINIAGGSPNGLWQLMVYDLNPGSVGQLASAQLVFDNQPYADPVFTYNIVGDSVVFNSANEPGVSYSWNFGGTGTSTDANPIYAFPATGTYDVTLITTDTCSVDSSVQSISVIVYNEPLCTSAFSFAGTPLNIPDNDSTGVSLSLNLTGVTGTSLGNDVNLVKVCITGAITNCGDIKATLVAPNGVAIDLIDRPGYPLSPTGCSNADFDFCVVRGFGNDNENSCESTPPAVSGIFTAMEGFNLDSINQAGGNPNGIWQLIVYDLNAGSAGQITGAQLIFDNQPQADASFNATVNGYDVTFNSQNQPGVIYSWSFGDTFTSTDAVPTHTYLSNGTYTVALSATDSCGTVVSSQTVILNQVDTCLREYPYAGVPVIIPDNDSTGITSVYTLNNVTGNALGVDVRLTKVCISGTHGNVGDLVIKLTAPGGKEIILMDRPGYPATSTGCDGDDFDFCITGGFDFDNENECNAISPAISGEYSAVGGNLDSINYYGGNPNGNWILTMSDNNATEIGELTSWKLQFNAQPPIADFTYIINGSSVDFFGPAIQNAQYSWNFGDTVTSNLQNPTHVYTQSGTYQVVLTVTDSCGTTNSTQQIPITVGIDETGGLTLIQIIPNPATNYVDIKIDNRRSARLILEIANSIGELIYTQSISSNEKSISRQINCSQWSKGVYTVKLSDIENVQQMKLVIQ